jgi:hypothetical protein
MAVSFSGIRKTPIINAYPWVTNVVLKSGALEKNVGSWLESCPAATEDEGSLCKVFMMIYLVFFVKSLLFSDDRKCFGWIFLFSPKTNLS